MIYKTVIHEKAGLYQLVVTIERTSETDLEWLDECIFLSVGLNKALEDRINAKATNETRNQEGTKILPDVPLANQRSQVKG